MENQRRIRMFKCFGNDYIAAKITKKQNELTNYRKVFGDTLKLLFEHKSMHAYCVRVCVCVLFCLWLCFVSVCLWEAKSGATP